MEKRIPPKYYICPICKLTYTSNSWAKKCYAWCKGHPSCNLNIARHSIEAQKTIEKPDISKDKPNSRVKKFPRLNFFLSKLLTGIFYILIGLVASVALFIFYDFLLTRTSSITTFYLNTKDTSFYMWYFIISSVLALILFGVDVSLTVYLLRRTGRITFREQGGNTTGVIIGAFAASCPVCSGVLLSLIGITGGLAAFPFKGLELKTLSVVFLAIPLFFLVRRAKNPNCDGKCPTPRNASFKKIDTFLLFSLILFFIAEVVFAYSLLRPEPIFANFFYSYNNKIATGPSASYTKRVQDVTAEVLPKEGFTSRLVLGDIVPQMVSFGIIDMQKMEDLYKQTGGMPKGEKELLTKPSASPVIISSQNANWIINILWAIGLSNEMDINKQSPVYGPNVNNFASTGGWTLGRQPNGGSYFNKYKLIPLTVFQQTRVKLIAQNTYRPCCDNSSFFQDCNHGSAAMALIELGVSQGLSDDEIYKTLLAFNSFWFPQNYTETALYFNVIKNTDWDNVKPQIALSKDYSSISGWIQNVDTPIRKIPGLLPKPQNGGSCGA